MHSVVRETSFRAFSLLAGCNDYGTQEMRPLAYDFRFGNCRTWQLYCASFLDFGE